MNPASASYYIEVYLGFRRGVLRQRTLSEAGYRYYLQHILDESGKDALKVALGSLKKLAKYQTEKKLSSVQLTNRIYNEFIEKI